MSALSHMVDRLDHRPPHNTGYVTGVPELQAILSELSPLVPVGIHLSELQFAPDTELSVTIKLGFTIERNLL